MFTQENFPHEHKHSTASDMFNHRPVLFFPVIIAPVAVMSTRKVVPLSGQHYSQNTPLLQVGKKDLRDNGAPSLPHGISTETPGGELGGSYRGRTEEKVVETQVEISRSKSCVFSAYFYLSNTR